MFSSFSFCELGCHLQAFSPNNQDFRTTTSWRKVTGEEERKREREEEKMPEGSVCTPLGPTDCYGYHLSFLETPNKSLFS